MRDTSPDILAALLRVRDRHNRLNDELVLQDATDPDHELHDQFTWDDTVAGHKYRLIEAHNLIVRCKVAYRDPTGQMQQVRKFHAIRKQTGVVYDPVEEVVNDPVSLRILLADMERDWRAMKARYDHLEQFRDLILHDLVGTPA